MSLNITGIIVSLEQVQQTWTYYGIVSASFNLFFFLTIYVFHKFAARSEVLRQRLPEFVAVKSISVLLIFNIYLFGVPMLFPIGYFTPCVLYLFGNYVGIPVFLFANTLRCIHLLFLYYLNQVRYLVSQQQARRRGSQKLDSNSMPETMNNSSHILIQASQANSSSRHSVSSDKGPDAIATTFSVTIPPDLLNMSRFDILVFKFAKWLHLQLKGAKRKRRKGSESVESKPKEKRSSVSASAGQEPMPGSTRKGSTLNIPQDLRKSVSGLSVTGDDVDDLKEISDCSSFNARDLSIICGIIVTINLILFFLVISMSPGYPLYPIPKISETCPLNANYLIYFQIFVYLVITPFFLNSLRKIPDPYGIKIELFVNWLVMAIMFPIILLSGVFTIFLNFGISTLMALSSFTVHVMIHVYPMILVLLENAKNKRMKGIQAKSVATSKNPTEITLSFCKESFDTVMKTPRLYSDLKKVMADTFCMENILFLEQYQRIQDKYAKTPRPHDPNLSEAERAKISTDIRKSLIQVAKEFVLPGSAFELNLSSKVRGEFFQSLKIKVTGASMSKKSFTGAESGNDYVDLTVMDAIHTEVIRMIYNNSFPKFLAAKNPSFHK